ncbi:MAG TPA: mannose-1-phosphate guanylyltransferase/mannose-6-phosphate isomerase [Nitrobacter sp.]|nr:mannose-1-phosphate guanylyltransferase/mannose-6-phosphate isomerase [Nitrobacter sp.]
MTEITPVILSGGSGTRLWPLSRVAKPKQLQPLAGPQTMLQATVDRVRETASFNPPIVVASERHADEIEAQLAAIDVAPAALILEPAGRNTAPAAALAALVVEPGAILLVLPSDHVIQDAHAFMAAVQAGLPLAREGWLVTFGIRPSRAETGYGYIRRGDELAPGVFRAVRFIEKPDGATAARYLAEGCYDWNGGIFLFRADQFLAELHDQAPDILGAARASVAAARCAEPRLYPDKGAFAASRSQSIDHAVMENARRIVVVPVDMGWSDVGSWAALYDIATKDESGNARMGPVLVTDSRNCLLRSDGPLLAAVGVDDLIIVATDDAIVVLPRAESQRVKDLVDSLEREGRSWLK